jgi:DNA-binding CsgD family transcriptional regulator
LRGGNFINWELLERADYSRPEVVKGLLRNYDGLMRLAIKGDSVALAICIDLRMAIHEAGVLTFKQRRYLSLWWRGFSYTDIAAMHHRSPSVVKRRVDLGVNNIKKHLTRKGNIKGSFANTIYGGNK